MYKLVEIKTEWMTSQSIQRLSDNAFIPFDPDNSDYQAYLKWLEEGNVPESAE
ncbi:hypothetical protein UFOVP192_40 [uncultured Caudovirales phage]|uniref:Uncharacterized protein n=1 Tax=uncultured Caudovirales phage TaxID=2100421 RepID=A0A6J7WG20_9CAUD|nr:hypothetical protein UFOVP192_40 [uncultured Caudovirales phage]